MYILKEYLEHQGIIVSKELAENLKAFKPVTLSKGAFFQKEGAVCKKIAFLSKGKIRHFYNIDGKEHTRWVSFENTFVTSFASFIDQQAGFDTLECIEPCELYVASREDFLALRNTFSEISRLWTQALENEMIGYEHRVFQLISNDAEKRYINLLQLHPQFILEIPQKYVASMLGIEPRHLSRIRKKIAAKQK
ncbi:MAG TPA: Crp/Fnr family transcriptional regulator [Flavobacteriia bacterium]|jgi:CRP-like cAMP-binding protein|nr:Crp/Fnr family transcriptional regulator [Flavobacteriia bacterium]